MNNLYIRRKTAIVVVKQGKYLVGMTDWGSLIWSDHIYDAWRTRNRPDAVRVAGKTGGSLVLFNPVTGQTAPLEMR